MSTAALVRPHYIGLQAALQSDAALQAENWAVPPAVRTGVGIYRGIAPTDAKLPYITIGAFSEFEIAAFGSGGSEIPWLIHFWGKMGTAQVMTLWTHTRRILTDDVPVVGGTVYHADVDLVDVGPDADPSIEHGRVRYRAQLEETP